MTQPARSANTSPTRASQRSRPKRKKKQPRTPKQQRCMICKKLFRSVSASHLRTHGYTAQRYSRVYGMRPSAMSTQRVEIGSVSDPNTELMTAVSERLVGDKAWVACLADEVGERMMNGPLRQRLSYLLTTMLHQRACVHGQALTVLSGALEELQQAWRFTQAACGSGPVDTETLLKMVDRASKLVSDSEGAVQKTVKLALDEQRTAAEFADSNGPPLYQGTGESLEMPTGVTSGDREIIRSLLSMVGQHASGANIIDVEATPLRPAPAGEQPGPQVPAEEAPPTTPSPTPTLDALPAPLDGGSLTDPQLEHRDGSVSDPTAMP